MSSEQYNKMLHTNHIKEEAMKFAKKIQKIPNARVRFQTYYKQAWEDQGTMENCVKIKQMVQDQPNLHQNKGDIMQNTEDSLMTIR